MAATAQQLAIYLIAIIIDGDGDQVQGDDNTVSPVFEPGVVDGFSDRSYRWGQRGCSAQALIDSVLLVLKPKFNF